MNNRITIVLFFVTLLVVGGIYYLRQTVPATRDQEEMRRYALIFAPEDIRQIEITRDNSVVVLERTATGWQIKAPIEDRASPEAVDQLLSSVRFLEVRDRERDKDSAIVAESGLRSPRMRLLLRGERDYRLDVGAESAVPGQIYVRTGKSDAILRVPDTVMKPLSMTVDELRDPRLTDLVADDIAKFTVRRADGEMTLRRERGGWIIEKPVRTDADLRAVRAFLDSLLGVRVTGFKPVLAAAATAIGIPGQAATISFTTRRGSDFDVEILRSQDAGKNEESVAAQFLPRGGGLEVDATALSIFEVSPELLRDRSLGFVDPDTVDRIVLVSRGKKVNLQRAGDGEEWEIAGENVRLAKKDVTELFETFNSARVQTFRPSVEPEKTGLNGPQESIQFYSWLSENTAEDAAGAHALGGIEFGSLVEAGDGETEGKEETEKGRNVYARLARSGEVVVVEPKLAELIRGVVGE